MIQDKYQQLFNDNIKLFYSKFGLDKSYRYLFKCFITKVYDNSFQLDRYRKKIQNDY